MKITGKTNEEKIVERNNTIFPWFMGLSSDLLFWVAIDTLFLTIVKGFSASQISLLVTLPSLIGIILQLPILRVINKIGNTKSIRLGTFFLLCSNIFITFGNSFFWVLIGKLLYEIAFSFKNMESIALKNDLVVLNKDNEYLKLKNKSNVVYSIITMIIALIAGKLFNINHYLPMYLCIIFCFFNFLLSFYVFEVNDDKEYSKGKIEKNLKENSEKIKPLNLY